MFVAKTYKYIVEKKAAEGNVDCDEENIARCRGNVVANIKQVVDIMLNKQEMDGWMTHL